MLVVAGVGGVPSVFSEGASGGAYRGSAARRVCVLRRRSRPPSCLCLQPPGRHPRWPRRVAAAGLPCVAFRLCSLLPPLSRRHVFWRRAGTHLPACRVWAGRRLVVVAHSPRPAGGLAYSLLAVSWSHVAFTGNLRGVRRCGRSAASAVLRRCVGPVAVLVTSSSVVVKVVVKVVSGLVASPVVCVCRVGDCCRRWWSLWLPSWMVVSVFHGFGCLVD